MNKSMWAALVIFVLIVVCGILEVRYVKREYVQFGEVVTSYKQKAEQNSFDQFDADALYDQWEELREKSEMFLPHLDSYEITLRVAECCCYIKQNDIDNALVQLCIIEKIIQYIPDLMRPDFQHIF